MKNTLIKAVLVVLVLGIAVPQSVLAADSAADVYKSKCAMCHGPDGAGQTATGKAMKVRDLGSADVQKQSDAELKTIIDGGKNKMPAYKGKLTDPQIDELVKYIRTLKK